MPIALPYAPSPKTTIPLDPSLPLIWIRPHYASFHGLRAIADQTRAIRIPVHMLEEVGQSFQVTRECIRQIEAKALRKLRNRSRRLKAFVDGVKEV